MAAPTTSEWFTQWHWSWVGLCLVLVLGVPYFAGWVKARGSREPISVARLVAYGLALFLVVYSTMGALGVFSSTYLWVFALRIGLLNAVVPLGLAVGRPVEAFSHLMNSQAPYRWVRSSVARVFMFPAVSSVLAALSVMSVPFTGYGQAAVNHPGVDALLVVHMVLVGLLVVLPLVGEDMLPKWATPGVRTLIACLDGLLDALPGILVMTSSSLLLPNFPGFSHAAHAGFSATLDQKFAGGALIAVAESIGIPMLIVVFLEWMRADERTAREADRLLDEQEEAGEAPGLWWVDRR